MNKLTVITDEPENLADNISNVLTKRNIKVKFPTAEAAKNSGIITISVDQCDEALQALRDASYNTVTEDSVLVRVKDEPGSLAKLSRQFLDADIQVRGLRILKKENDHHVVAISADHPEHVIKLATDLDITF